MSSDNWRDDISAAESRDEADMALDSASARGDVSSEEFERLAKEIAGKFPGTEYGDDDV
jgi:uncharacterized membrane protein